MTYEPRDALRAWARKYRAQQRIASRAPDPATEDAARAKRERRLARNRGWVESGGVIAR